ncbi:hypothetical protein HMPREF1118_1541 [Haemophilus parainfluenzae HK262]|nr:hypothetical protein HMPREF1118_1541 [Haemophilus parainfluenzae HK262]
MSLIFSNLNRLKFLKKSDRTFPLLGRPPIKDQKQPAENR